MRGQDGARPLLRGAVGALDGLLGDALLRASRKRGDGVVVLYHRVSAEEDSVYMPLHPDAFGAHLDMLTRYFDVLSMSEWLARLGAGRSLRKCCTITFDDGYRDFLDSALPRLRERALPCTHFLVTACLADGKEPWTLRARRLGFPGGAVALAAMGGEERDRVLDAAERPSSDVRGAAMLREGDVPSLLDSDVDVGSHTTSHAWLTRIGAAEMSRELHASRTRLAELCGRDVDLVSYPQGLHDADVRATARRAGYKAGFAVGQRATSPSADPMAIPRFDLTDRPVGMVRLELSGVLPTLRRARRP